MPIDVDKAEWFDDRCYRIKIDKRDHYIASVTTKLSVEDKPFLYRYYADLGWAEAKKRIREAQDRGVRIHYAWYIYIMGGVVIYNSWRNPTYSEKQIYDLSQKHNGMIAVLPEQSEMVAMWKLQRFFEKVQPKIVHAEKTVYSIEKDIAGTLDNAFHIQAGHYDVSGSEGLTIPTSGIYLADLKTGNQISESAWAQLAAYCEAFRDMGLGDPVGAFILHPGASTKKRN